MKKFNYYTSQGICSKNVLNYLISTCRPSIGKPSQVWDYFVNWNKIELNLQAIKCELNILNSLIGSAHIEKDFIKLIKKNPKIIKVFPFLLAVRENKLRILKNYKSKDFSYMNFDFKKEKISHSEALKYLEFFQLSELINLFNDKKIKNLQDYMYGIEVGLNANGRKNRGGKLMESIVEIFISEHCQKKSHLSYLSQATPNK